MSEGNDEYGFVELHRTFREVSTNAGEADYLDLGNAFHLGERLKWADLLDKFRVVVLSEAGTGKTEELHHVAETLQEEGKTAFFLRLEHIANDFEEAFEAGSLNEFERWLASGNEGWLLLDSVDEARLRSPGDFELAIRKLGRRIADALQRVRIVLAGRTTAWRPKTDLDLCLRHLPYKQPSVTATAADETEEEGPDLPHSRPTS